MLNIPNLFQQHNITPKGVIHIGAHHGEELDMYLSMGFKTVLFLEADPDTFKVLAQNIQRSPAFAQGRVMAIQVAISDHDGNATFYRTNNSQSNSLLKLKDHLEVYPQITAIGHIAVPCRNLDTLLIGTGGKLHPANFNYLHMDIQGGEMKALLGAAQTLQYIEAITAEVNTREMYEGTTLMPEMEEWLEGGGRRYQRQDAVVGGDGWGDAFYVRAPFVQMSCIGHLGRFGNACWQYMFGSLKSDYPGVDFRTNWADGGIFYLGEQIPCLPDIPTDYEDTHLIEKSGHANAQLGDLLGKDLLGFYQFHTSHYAHRKGTIRDTFRLRTRNTVPAMLAVAHMRWGDDYGQMPQRAPFFRTPPEQIRAWFKDVEKAYMSGVGSCSSMGLASHLATDTPDADLLDLGIVTYGHVQQLAYDFDMMVNANYLLVSNSSLSMFAALLNRNFDGDGWKGHCFRPVPKLGPGKIVEAVHVEVFDPWNAEVLLGK